MSNHEADQNFIDNYKIKVGDTKSHSSYTINKAAKILEDICTTVEEIENNDKISHPEHYTHSKIEAWDFLKDFPYLDGNAMKYIIRHKHKNGKEDLLKAKAYLDKMIKEYYES